MGNETISSSHYSSGIFLPKIIKIGECLTKLRLMKGGDVFLKHSVEQKDKTKLLYIYIYIYIYNNRSHNNNNDSEV